MSLLKTLLPLLTLVVLISAEPRQLLNGTCPKRKVMPKFQLNRYMGVWNVFKTYKSNGAVFGTTAMECVQQEYFPADDGGFRFTIVGDVLTNEKKFTVNYTGEMISAIGSGSIYEARYYVRIDGNGSSSGAYTIYNILYSDYKRYAIINICKPVRFAGETGIAEMHVEEILILTHPGTVKLDLEQEMDGKVKSFGWDPDRLEKKYDDQTCSKETKRFLPGPCPQRKVMPNFRLDKHMGDWYGYKTYNFRPGDEKCIHEKYTKTGTDEFRFVSNNIRVVSNETKAKWYLGHMVSTEGKGSTQSASFRSRNSRDASPTYNIVYNDYIKYALIYYCKSTRPSLASSAKEVHKEFLLVLTRSKTVEQDLDKEIDKKVEETLKLNPTKLTKTYDQTCPDY